MAMAKTLIDAAAVDEFPRLAVTTGEALAELDVRLEVDVRHEAWR